MTTCDSLLIDVNLPLDKLLKNASHEELVVLTDIVTDKGKGRVSLSNEVNKLLRHHKARHTLHQVTNRLAVEICAFGGNTLVNMMRSGTVNYREVVLDATTKLGAKVPKNASIIEVEELIIQKVLKAKLENEFSLESIEKICIQQGVKLDLDKLKKIKQQGDIFALTSFILSHAMPYAVFNFLSPAWPIYDLWGPAYRVTIPAVICIATIRQKWSKSLTDYYCMELKKCL